MRERDPMKAFLRTTLAAQPRCRRCEVTRSETIMRDRDGRWSALCWRCTTAPPRATHHAGPLGGAEVAALAPRPVPPPRDPPHRQGRLPLTPHEAPRDLRRADCSPRGALPLVAAPKSGRR
jgi:hypothetical protein